MNKKITVGSAPAVMFSHNVVDHSGEAFETKCAVEFNFLIWDKEVIARPRLFKARYFSLKDQYSDISLDFHLDRELTVFLFPVFSINETEAGLGKTFQGISVFIGNEFSSGSGEINNMEIAVSVLQR